jgi:hypothetical protein
MLTYKVGIMTKLLALLFLLVSLVTHAQTAPVLKVGDVLLQPLNCWACSLIEAEEETIFSHIGIVLAVEPEVLIGEAFGTVRKIGLAEFNAKTERGQKLLVIRFRNDDLSDDIHNAASAFMKMFDDEFLGAKYDHDFRWNNFDESGDEKFYCSEMVSKLFQAFVHVETPIKRMHFQRNRDNWTTYFRGNIPDNEWGNSPGDFERSELFYHVGEL